MSPITHLENTQTDFAGYQPAVDTGGDLLAENEEFLSARAIISHLQGHTKDLDAELSVSERADLVAFKTLIQTSIEPATLYTLWCENESFNKHTQVSAASVIAQCHQDAIKPAC